MAPKGFTKNGVSKSGGGKYGAGKYSVSTYGVTRCCWSDRFGRLADESVAAIAKRGCRAAIEHLLSKYRGFVEGKARSYFLAGAEQEDVVQEGMIGLYKAIRDFRADRRASFRSFADLCVTRQIITAVKAARREKQRVLNDCVSLDGNYGDEESAGCLADIVADPRVIDPEKEVLDRLAADCVELAARRELSELEYEVLRGYVNGRTYGEIASHLERPSKTVDNALQRAKRKVAECAAEVR